MMSGATMHDYYSILGVSPAADFEAIRQAYRQLALVHHPDRGGSHEAMVRINEAWNVLSNPVARQEYDLFRKSGRTTTDFHTPAAEKARSDAADYPAEWSEFDKWWSGMGADFHKTKFERNKGGGHMGLIATANTPSGICFIIGGVLVFWWLMPDGFLWPLWGNRNVFFKMLLVLTVGSWIGVLLHKMTRALFFDAPAPAANAGASTATTVSFSTASHQSGSVARSGTPVMAQIECPVCRQALRVPDMARAIRVTCRSCGHVFQKSPNSVPPPIPK